MANFIVKFAVYGALEQGKPESTYGLNAAPALQQLLHQNQGVVTIANQTMGIDPAYGNKKHFAAVVSVDGIDGYFACEENQTIDFNHFHNSNR